MRRNRQAHPAIALLVLTFAVACTPTAPDSDARDAPEPPVAAVTTPLASEVPTPTRPPTMVSTPTPVQSVPGTPTPTPGTNPESPSMQATISAVTPQSPASSPPASSDDEIPPPPGTPLHTALPTPEATGDPAETSRANLEAARADWSATGRTSYTYVLTRDCLCRPDYIGPFTIEVGDGVVVSASTDDGPVDASGLPTITGLHDFIEQLLDDGGLITDGGYDAQGLPDGLRVDRVPDGSDDEVVLQADLRAP